MNASTLASTKAGRAAAWRAAWLACLSWACVEEKPGVEGTTSLRVEIVSPADLGSEEARLPDGARDVTLRVTALDEQGRPDEGFAAVVDVYTHFLGTLTPERGAETALTLSLERGVGEGTLTLPPAYGPTFLWVEDARGDAATYATGTSPRLWYRDPFLADLSRPSDETSLLALERSPLEGKQVRVVASQHGDEGRLVVTGVYAQGYTVSDVRCSGGAPPCVAVPYAHIYVYTFGRPRAEDGAAIRTGQLVSWVSGGVGEFNGLTELNFPQTGLESAEPREEFLPPPVVLEKDWLASPTGATGMIHLERLESALVAVENGVVCPLDADYTQYGQWKLDVGLGCGRPYHVVTQGAVAEFDPAAHVGRTLPRVVGTLRAVNIGTFHVWIVYPRRPGDVVTP